MGTRTEAYVDTSAFIAFLDESDSWHPFFRKLFADAPPLLTTPLVVAEGHGWFLRRYDRRRALEFLSFLEFLEPLSVTDCRKSEREAAIEVLRRFSDQDLTLADALGLAMMADRGTKVCWSTDFHLGLTGVPLVIHAG